MRALLIGAALLAALPARADWQYTRWGMNADEVAAAAGRKAERGNWQDRSSDVGRALVSAPYESQGLRFQADFLFSRSTGGLNTVLLKANPDECQRVLNALHRAYSYTPVHTATDTLETFSWKDFQNRNEVTLSWMIGPAPFCILRYEPLLAAGAKGGL